MADSEVIKVDLPSGAAFWINADTLDGSSHAPDGPSDVAFRGMVSFDVMTSTLKGIATEVRKAVQAAAPDVTEVEFGLEMAVKGAKVVCLVVDGEAKATMRVRMEWHKSGANGDA
ncbi:CU044_2847 family protein [Nonomuraea rubra]